MDDSGHAQIADFGLATVTKNRDSTKSVSRHAHTPRWSAPEVFTKGKHSKEADIFAFAMVMIEVCYGRSTECRVFTHCRLGSNQVFTGAVPFSDMTSFMAMLVIMKGQRPPRPTHPAFTDELWTLMQRCWDSDPNLRPGVSEVLRILLTWSVPYLF